ncbi:hypothetical protein M0805_004930 [Coniferiporia weirii]|nr:hypothetical protein M0805_004930 [Coniferiporia weirii]
MVAAPTQPPQRPPALLEATKRSTAAWQDDLQSLFHRAKDRFPDVVWDLVDEDAADDVNADEVWGHKAIVYARAPPSFQARYFSFRPAPVASPQPYAASPSPSIPMPATSALSLNLGVEFPYAASLRSGSPSHFRSASPAPSVIGALTRIPLAHNPALFANELEYLYTGKGFGAAFEFLFDANEKGAEGDADAEEARIDKLRKDLVFMWRSRLYSDVRIELHGDMSSALSPAEEETTAVFSSHRFILVTRSPYFYDQLVTYGLKNAPAPGEPATVRLPAPPFTPPALHFMLGFLYSGTLNFSNRTYDLDTGFAILCSANYLQLQTLHDEVQARLVQEMLHGLFHAFLEFAEYERITGGRWGTGGCRCKQCARRAPRTLLFAVRPDVQNVYLERGARRALVGLFGEGWCTAEFAALPQKTKDGLLTGLAKRTLPANVFPLLFAAHAALRRLGSVRDAWADGIRDMVTTARGVIDNVLCNEPEKCFSEHEWIDILENDGLGRFEDGERVEWTMDAVRRGMSESNAGMLYQTLVSSILLRPHPTEPNESLLSSISQIRVQVEQTRMDLIRWLRRRWVGVRQEGGFDALESWSLKEISHEIDVPVEDLLTPVIAPARGPPTRTGLRPTLSKVDDTTDRDSMSTSHSLRASVLNKNMARTNNNSSGGTGGVPLAPPMRNTTRSLASSRMSSRLSASTSATERERKESRPDSKLAPVSPRSRSSAMDIDTSADEPEEGPGLDITDSQNSMSSTDASRKDASDTVSIASVHQTSVISVQRPKSVANSTRSHASTIRRNVGAATATLRPPRSPARPTSAASVLSTVSKSEASTTSTSVFKTPRESMSRSRKISSTSTVSNLSVRSGASRSPRTPAPILSASRPRRSSETGAVATPGAPRIRKISAASTSTATPGGKTLVVRRSPSATSIRSTASQSPPTKRAAIKKSPSTEDRKSAGTGAKRPNKPLPPDKPLPRMPSKENVDPDGLTNTSSTLTVKGKARADTITAANKSARSSGGGSNATRRTLRRKESNDTITIARVPAVKEKAGVEGIPGEVIGALQPRGATLDIGIPCIISSKRKRFRAFARYIGEVEGERGPWVGVEVPLGDTWAGEQLEGQGRQWHDGSWGGIRYFEVGATASEWGDDDRAARRRRVDWMNGNGAGQKGTKREGDQLSLSVERRKRFRSASPSMSDMSGAEYRGLFVRPQQVLYVVDAVGSDL